MLPGSRELTGVAAPALPLPPDFTACIAGQRKQTGSTAATTTGTLKALCAKNYQALLNQILPFLIQTVWIQGEAADRGVKVSDAKLESSFQQARDASNPPLKTTAEMNSFLAKSGETIADLKWYLYVKLLYAQVELKVQKDASKVTSAQIAAYYNKNLARYATPGTHNLHLVETATLASAATVKSLLASGSSYAAVAQQYSIDPTTRAAGGRWLGVSASELNAQLSAAVFAAKIGVLSGPVKTAFGYYVFTVDSATPGSVTPLKKVGIDQVDDRPAAGNQSGRCAENRPPQEVDRADQLRAGYVVSPGCPKTLNLKAGTPSYSDTAHIVPPPSAAQTLTFSATNTTASSTASTASSAASTPDR